MAEDITFDFPMLVKHPNFQNIDTSAAPQEVTQGVPYTGKINGTGGVPPYSFELSSGALPAGLTLGGDGTISGTPTGPTGTTGAQITMFDSAP